ncbi:hypothetical protein [Entomobacter blattae]|uniref:hypothetical protein n=1 Tax=Entomobacter blattae TaxID=2762277 RepID=UPI00193BD3A2|nr:hypothetical protein [Entomobacter blattae]
MKALLFRYFHPQYCPAGMWADQLDEHHNSVGDKIPASSFYHSITGYCELHKLMKSFTIFKPFIRHGRRLSSEGLIWGQAHSYPENVGKIREKLQH